MLQGLAETQRPLEYSEHKISMDDHDKNLNVFSLDISQSVEPVTYPEPGSLQQDSKNM